MLMFDLFTVSLFAFQKLVKRFYCPNSGRNPGSLPNFKVVLANPNVNGKVKGHFQAHEDFLHTVGEGLLLKFCLDQLGMKSWTDKPSIQGLPGNIASMQLKNRKPFFLHVTEQIVNHLFSSFKEEEQQLFVQVNLNLQGLGNFNVQIPADLLQQQGYVDLLVPGTGQVVRVPHQHEMQDEMYNYSTQFLQWYIHLCEFQDGVREGDPFRTNINLKRMIPFFYSHSHRSKYAVECIDYILKTELLLPKALSIRTRLGSFVNPHGVPGGNKAADMQQENNILVLKDVIKTLGASKTDKAMVRGSLAAPVIGTIVNNYRAQLGCHMRSGRHRTRDRQQDVEAVLTVVNRTNPFNKVPGRTMPHYRGILQNPFSSINITDFNIHLDKIIQRLRRGLNVDLDYYNE